MHAVGAEHPKKCTFDINSKVKIVNLERMVMISLTEKLLGRIICFTKVLGQYMSIFHAEVSVILYSEENINLIASQHLGIDKLKTVFEIGLVIP